MSATAMTAQVAPDLPRLDEARVWVAGRLDVEVPETLTDLTVAQVVALRYPGGTRGWIRDHGPRRTTERSPRRDLVARYDVMDGRNVVRREVRFTTSRTERTGLDVIALDMAALDAHEIGYGSGVVLRDVLDAATHERVPW